MNIGKIIGGLFILIICTAPIVIIGIVQFNSKNPVGFWSGKEPPKKEQIIDVRGYNRRHGIMWILYGAGLIGCFVCGQPFGELIAAYLCMMEAIGGIFVMAAYHNKLNRMYYKE